MSRRSIMKILSCVSLITVVVLARTHFSVFAYFHIRSVPSSANGFNDPPFTCPDTNATPFAVALDNSVPVPAPGSCDLSQTQWFLLPTTGNYPDRAFSLSGSMPSNPNTQFTVTVTPALWTSATSDTSSQTIFLIQFSATDQNLALASFVAGKPLSTPVYVGCNDSVPLNASRNSSLPGFCTPMPPVPAYLDDSAKSEPVEPPGITAADLTTTRWDLANFKAGTAQAPAVIALSAFGFPSEFVNASAGTHNDNRLAVSDFDSTKPNFLAVIVNTSTNEVATGGALTLKPSPAAAPPAPTYDVQSNAKVISFPAFSETINVTNALPQPDAQLDLPVANAQNDPLLPVQNPCDSTTTISQTLFRTVWYSYTPTSTGAIHLDTSGSRYDTYLAVYPNPPVSLFGSVDDQSIPADDPLVQAKLDITPTPDMVSKPLLIEVAETPTLVCDFTTNVSGSPLLLPASTDATLAFSLFQDGTPATALSASTLFFNAQLVGTTSPSQAITLTNPGTANLVVTGVAVPAGFSKTENCSSAPVAPGKSCTVSVSFAPSAQGAVSGSLTFTDDATGFPNTVGLSGTGTDFSLLAPANGTGTLTASSPATYTVTASGTPGFSDTVSFACSKPPINTTCSFSPATVSPGAGSAQITLTVSRISATSLQVMTSLFSASLGFGAIVLLCLRSRQADFSVRWVVPGLLLLASAFVYACGGGSGSTPAPVAPSPVQPTAGSYTFQVIPSVGGTPLNNKAITLSLTVQ
jgi:hypothetical protein